MLYSNLCKALKPETTIILTNLFHEQIDLDTAAGPKSIYNAAVVLDMITCPAYGKNIVVVRLYDISI